MKIFKDKAFSAICGDDASYGFFGRTGGVSEGIYTSLNCGPGSLDNPEAVIENRKRVAAKLEMTQDISTLSQCHSALCLLIDKPIAAGKGRPEADALVTDVPGLSIGVLTADCGPVLLFGRKANGSVVVGAAHAGWGGALGGILEDTVHKMIQAGAERNSLKACLGPCIMQPSYEVQDAFMTPFLEKHPESEKFFKSGRKAGHRFFDMPGYIAMRLSLAGVNHLSMIGVDTYKEEADCFSFRRATHRGEGDYGREMSAIVINK